MKRINWIPVMTVGVLLAGSIPVSGYAQLIRIDKDNPKIQIIPRDNEKKDKAKNGDRELQKQKVTLGEPKANTRPVLNFRRDENTTNREKPLNQTKPIFNQDNVQKIRIEPKGGDKPLFIGDDTRKITVPQPERPVFNLGDKPTPQDNPGNTNRGPGFNAPGKPGDRFDMHKPGDRKPIGGRIPKRPIDVSKIDWHRWQPPVHWGPDFYRHHHGRDWAPRNRFYFFWSPFSWPDNWFSYSYRDSIIIQFRLDGTDRYSSEYRRAQSDYEKWLMDELDIRWYQKTEFLDRLHELQDIREDYYKDRTKEIRRLDHMKDYDYSWSAIRRQEEKIRDLGVDFQYNEARAIDKLLDVLNSDQIDKWYDIARYDVDAR